MAKKKKVTKGSKALSALTWHPTLPPALPRAAGSSSWRNLVPSLEPVSAAQKKAMDAAGRGSGVIDPTRTGTDPGTIEHVRSQYNGPGRAGWSALSALVGPDLAAHIPGTMPPPGKGKAVGLTHIGPVPVPTGVVTDAAMLPFVWPRKSLEIAHAGEALKGGGRGLPSSTPVRSAAKNVRRFKAGDYTAEIPAAGSRTGRVVERAVDKVRPAAAKAGIVKTEVERAGLAAGREAKFQQSVNEVPTLMLRKAAKKLKPPEEYALRVIAEGALPETRIAHHIDLAATGSKEQALYHAEHASMVHKAAKYIEPDAEGRAVLRPDAPKALHNAWRWFQESGDVREHLLGEIGRISDAQVAARIMAPARVLHGARYQKFEQIVSDALAGSKPREELFAAVDAIVTNSARAEALKASIDGLTRSAAERAGTSLEPQGLLSNIEGVKTGAEVIPDEALIQKGGEIPEPSSYGIKGAIEFTPQNAAIIHLTTAADETTFAHEMAHLVRRHGLNPKEEQRIAKWAGAKRVNGQYEWSKEAEERFARGLESFVMRGQGPPGLRQAFRSLSPAFREVYEHTDLPDVPPHVAQFFNKLFSYDKVKGGTIRGAEDITLGVAYAPTFRGMPLSPLTQPHKATAAYIRRASQAFFGGGRRTAIGAGPDDAALRKEYQGSLLLSGLFTKDVVGPKVQSTMLASRMAGAHYARKALLEVSTELPQELDDIAVKVDPTVQTSGELKRLWDKLASVEASGQKLTSADLEHTSFDLIESARNSLFPFHGSAEARQESELRASEALENQEPIENIRWVPREFMDSSGLLYVPKAARMSQQGMSKRQQTFWKATGIGFDAMNDFVKASILYLNPAYVPVQFVGNIGMALLQQGAFMPRNLARLSMLHRELEPIDRVTVDHLMQHGIFAATPMRTAPGAIVKNTLGSAANKMADWLPRRLAFIHEAYRDGYKPGDLQKLLAAARANDPEALHSLQMVADRANDAMVDFERMSPLERETINRYIFFYPWLRGATRYTVRFAADHPVQAVGIAMAIDHMLAAAEDQLGPRPFAQQLEIPVSTESAGFKVPGTDYGIALDQFVGKHAWMSEGHPVVESLRQLLTFTTPLDLIQSGVAFVGGYNPEAAQGVVQSLTPVPYALGVSMFGYDPFAKREVKTGLGTFLSQMSPETTSPIWAKWKRYNMSPEERRKYQERAIHPRTKNQEALSMGLGGVAPAPYNVKVGQERALENAPALEQRTHQLITESQEAGLGHPPPEVLEDLRWKTEVDHAIKNGMTYAEKAKAVASIFDARYGTHESGRKFATEGDAKAFYEDLRPQLYQTYLEWENQVQYVLDSKLEAQPVG